ncbi:MAG: DUF4838 domain-containing protein [Kiritimatiellae bacterium]|nr:DUF4838 domain-containing protein [Kiritimatiellia bacterium]
MTRVFAMVFAAMVFCGCVPEKEVFLVRDGAPQAHVVIDAGAGESVTNAANALVEWTKTKTGVELTGGTPIRFRLADDVKHDGFRIDASKKEIVVSAKEPRAFEYAVYYLLNRYAEIDWFHPESGADFEKADSFSIPAGTIARTPPPWRQGHVAGNPAVNPKESRKLISDWNVRNGFYDRKNRMGGHIIGEWLLWTPVDEGELKKEIAAINADFAGVFKQKPATDAAEMYARWKILAKQHPDWFAFVDGKRVPCSQQLIGNGHYNYLHRTAMPCLSNPEVREQMLKNYLRRRHSLWYAEMPDVNFSIICDDQPCWCECDQCMKLLKFKGMNGGEDKASDYYWDFVNWIAPRMLAADPTLTVNAYAYQSHRAFPNKVKPVPLGDRMNVVVCTHGRCFVHTLTNETCAANVPVRKMVEEWSAAGFPVLTFEYMCQTPGMCDYFFWEKTWIEDMKWYHTKNVSHGAGGLIGPWFGFYKTPYFDQNGAKARWFLAYLTGHFDWDIDDDFDTVRDRMLSKYYRSAGREMTAYHKYLESKLYDVGLCMPYSDTEHGAHDLFSQSVAGRPGVLEPAQKLLAAAKIAAKDDPVALERIAMDEKYFQVEWEAAAPLVTAENLFKNMRKLDDQKHGENYIYIGGVKPYAPIVKKLKVQFKAKGKAACRFVFKHGRNEVPPVLLDVDATDFKAYSFEIRPNIVVPTFLLFVTDWLELKDIDIRAEL